MDPGAIRQYLSFGFAPDAGLASEYLEGLFGVPGERRDDPSKLLTDLVEELTAGATDIAIPLSGGRDSRALLGAALRTFPNRRIHCFTFGPEGSEDVIGARAACRRVGIAHQVVHPDTVEWNLDALTDEMRRRLNDRRGIAPIDGMTIFGALASRIPPELPVLSGFLGIVAGGKHLGEADRAGDDSRVLDRFFSHNRAVLEERPKSMFRKFLASHERLLGYWPGLSKFDLLDFGFRQRLRIRSSVTGSFRNPVRVYEHRRWIEYWFSRPIAERINYEKYDALLEDAFPLIFGPKPLASRAQLWWARRSGSAGKGVYRGDPRQNPSMAAALDEACRCFDQRDYGVHESAVSAFNDLLREPTVAAFRRVRWFATAEILARAQERPAS